MISTEKLQNHRLAYPEAAWVARCGNSFPSRTQWLYKYLPKVDSVSKYEASRISSGGVNVNFSSDVMGKKVTVGTGSTADGVPIHEKVSLDWVKWAISKKVWDVLYNTEKINSNVGGSEIITNEVRRVLDIAVSEGIFVSYRIGDVVLDSTNNNISIKFKAQLEHTILSVEVSGSLYQ